MICGKPISKFPSLGDDILLYLCLTGIPGCGALAGRSFADAFATVETRPLKDDVQAIKSNQPSNDGNELDVGCWVWNQPSKKSREKRPRLPHEQFEECIPSTILLLWLL
jgi:hypothetical protein